MQFSISFSAISKAKMKKHMRTHLPKRIYKTRVKKRLNSDKLMCTQCGLLLQNNCALKKHMIIEHLKLKRFFCDLCQ